MSPTDAAEIAAAGLLLLLVVATGITARALLASRRIKNTRDDLTNTLNEWEK